MKKFNSPLAILCLFFTCLLVSCSSKEDKLVGQWGNSFGITNNYTDTRVYKEPGDACFQTFFFEKGENGEMGVFTDNITPLVIGGQNPDNVIIGSQISGTWKIKGDKLYLYFDKNSFALTNADMLGRTERMILEDQMAKSFLDEYKNLGEEGLNYKIVHKNNKTALEINFGNTKVTLVKREEKN